MKCPFHAFPKSYIFVVMMFVLFLTAYGKEESNITENETVYEVESVSEVESMSEMVSVPEADTTLLSESLSESEGKPEETIENQVNSGGLYFEMDEDLNVIHTEIFTD